MYELKILMRYSHCTWIEDGECFEFSTEYKFANRNMWSQPVFSCHVTWHLATLDWISDFEMRMVTWSHFVWSKADVYRNLESYSTGV